MPAGIIGSLLAGMACLLPVYSGQAAQPAGVKAPTAAGVSVISDPLQPQREAFTTLLIALRDRPEPIRSGPRYLLLRLVAEQHQADFQLLCRFQAGTPAILCQPQHHDGQNSGPGLTAPADNAGLSGLSGAVLRRLQQEAGQTMPTIALKAPLLETDPALLAERLAFAPLPETPCGCGDTPPSPAQPETSSGDKERAE